MSCHTIQNSLSAHMDGFLSEAERTKVLEHLAACADCTLRSRQLENVRAMLRKVPAAAPPPELTSALRVMASQERARTLTRRNPVAYWSDRFHLLVDNLMRPLALPFAGGLVSAMILFSTLMPNIRLQVDPRVDDVPIAFIYTEPTVKEQPFALNHEDDVTLEVLVDGSGRAVDYAMADGTKPANPELRREIQSNLLFTQFTPATAYGRPTLGRLFLSFTRTRLDVPSKS